MTLPLVVIISSGVDNKEEEKEVDEINFAHDVSSSSCWGYCCGADCMSEGEGCVPVLASVLSSSSPSWQSSDDIKVGGVECVIVGSGSVDAAPGLDLTLSLTHSSLQLSVLCETSTHILSFISSLLLCCCCINFLGKNTNLVILGL